MKKTLLLLITATLFAISTNAQTNLYSKYMQQGKSFYKKSQFLTALERFDLAREFAKTETQKTDTKTWKNKSRKKIRKQQADLKKALIEANKQRKEIERQKTELIKQRDEAQNQKILAQKNELDALTAKNKSDSLLSIAEKLQFQVEDAMFDKAVKEQQSEWNGWMNMILEEKDDEREKILKKIDTLNLSSGYLSKLPSQVILCPNLKHINLLGNRSLSWENSQEILNDLPLGTTFYFTVKDLNNIPEKYRHRVNGVEIFQEESCELDKFPKNLLQQKNMEYLSIKGRVWDRNHFNELPSGLFELKELKYLDLTYCSIEKIPLQIKNLKNLTHLIIAGNILGSLPDEIGKLKKLKLLDLRGLEFSKKEQKRTQKLLPNCKIIF